MSALGDRRAKAAPADKPLRHSPKCARCGRALNQHQAGDHQCPNGKRLPTGYASYGPGRYKAAP